jgi:hypothetical protein
MSDPLEPTAAPPASTPGNAESSPNDAGAGDAIQPAPKSVQFKFTFLYIFCDTVARYLILFARTHHLVGPRWFWTLQVLVVPTAVSFIAEQRKDKIRAIFKLSRDTALEVHVSPLWTAILCLLFLSDVYHFNELPAWGIWGKIFLFGPLLFFFLSYYVGIVLASLKAEKYVPAAEMDQPYDPDDENDRSLTRLQSRIASFERKVDSYTIESTLIGALAFSSFVTIASSDKVKIQDVYTFLRTCTFTQEVEFLRAHQNLMAPLGSEKTLLIVIAVSAILCSMFFIAVIVARLRFNELIGNAKYSSEMAAKFNAKEDDLSAVLLSQTTPVLEVQAARMERLRARIDIHLEAGFRGLERVRPNIWYMDVFRTFGLFSFIAALIASAAWVSPALAAGFTVIGLVAAVYPTIDGWLDRAREGAEKLSAGAPNFVTKFSKKG